MPDDERIVNAAEQVRQIARAATERALGIAAQEILRIAKERAPTSGPDDDDPTHNLRELGSVEDEPWGYRIIFEGPYAAAQHERLDYQHLHGGEAKYLEHALQDVVPELPAIVAAGIRAAMHGRT